MRALRRKPVEDQPRASRGAHCIRRNQAARSGRGGTCARRRPLDARFQSFPAQRFEIADVSLVEGTIAGCNYLFLFASPRNGIEEADGSIPFSSTKATSVFLQFRHSIAFPRASRARPSTRSSSATWPRECARTNRSSGFTATATIGATTCSARPGSSPTRSAIRTRSGAWKHSNRRSTWRSEAVWRR
jgi:hypothetical protein